MSDKPNSRSGESAPYRVSEGHILREGMMSDYVEMKCNDCGKVICFHPQTVMFSPECE